MMGTRKVLLWALVFLFHPCGGCYMSTGASFQWDGGQDLSEPDLEELEPELPACDGQEAQIVVPRDFESIQAAIDAAEDGQSICVEPGTYYETIDFQGKGVRVFGASGPEATVIDGREEIWAVLFSSGETLASILENVTITNARCGMGGAIEIRNASPLLQNIIVRDNRATGIFIQGGAPVIQHVALFRNKWLSHSSSPHGGGGLAAQDSTLTLRNAVLYKNWSEGPSAGITLERSTAAISHVLITKGTSYMGCGSALSLDASTAVVSNIIVTDNIGGRASHIASALCAINGSSLTVQNSVIARNTAKERDGAVLVILAGSTAHLANLSITENVTDDPIRYDFMVSCDEDSNIFFSYCNIWGNDPQGFEGVSDPTGTSGNISLDPQYLSTESENPLEWDLHASTTSPLIDAGDPALADPDGSRSDMGAFGGPEAGQWDLDADGFPSWWQPGTYDSDMYPSEGWDCSDQDVQVTAESGC